jgi:chemotaxis signal transduction protein
MSGTSGARLRVEEMREEFDRGFAEPPPAPAGRTEEFLEVEVGRDPYALRLAELSGVQRAPRLTALPGAPPEVLGLAAVRGLVVPVFDLAALLGYGRGEAQPPAIALCRGEPPIGLALGAVRRHLRVPAAAVQAGGPGKAERVHVEAFVRTAETVRPVIGIRSVLEAIRAPGGTPGPAKEG